MTISEQMWFAIGIAGFVIFIEGAVSYIFNRLNRKIPEQLSRAGAGLVLLIIAIVSLMNLPSG